MNQANRHTYIPDMQTENQQNTRNSNSCVKNRIDTLNLENPKTIAPRRRLRNPSNTCQTARSRAPAARPRRAGHSRRAGRGPCPRRSHRRLRGGEQLAVVVVVPGRREAVAAAVAAPGVEEVLRVGPGRRAAERQLRAHAAGPVVLRRGAAQQAPRAARVAARARTSSPALQHCHHCCRKSAAWYSPHRPAQAPSV